MDRPLPLNVVIGSLASSSSFDGRIDSELPWEIEVAWGVIMLLMQCLWCQGRKTMCAIICSIVYVRSSTLSINRHGSQFRYAW